MFAYLQNFYTAAKGKLTTYIALATAGLTELVGSWDQAVALMPHWIVAQKTHILAACSLLTIWSRIRKEL